MVPPYVTRQAASFVGLRRTQGLKLGARILLCAPNPTYALAKIRIDGNPSKASLALLAFAIIVAHSTLNR